MQQRRASAASWSPRNLLVGTSTIVAVLLLYSKALGSRTANLASDSDPAAVLAKSRRATLEAKWAQRRAHADAELRLAREQQQEAASPPEQAERRMSRGGDVAAAPAAPAAPRDVEDEMAAARWREWSPRPDVVEAVSG